MMATRGPRSRAHIDATREVACPSTGPATIRHWLVVTSLVCFSASNAVAQTTLPARSLLDSTSAYVFSHIEMQCRDFSIQEFSQFGLIKGCMGNLGDTLFIAYRTKSGVTLSITKRFFVERKRLRTVGDSVIRDLTEALGPERRCSQTMWTGSTFTTVQWHQGPITTQVAVNALNAPPRFNDRQYPWVGVQIARAALPCGDWLSEPRPL